MKKLLGLLCDLDGTLADSEPQHSDAWLTMLDEELNLQYGPEWFDDWVGTSDREVAAWLINEHDLHLTVQEMIDAKQREFHNIVRRDAKGFPGVPEALAEISGTYPLAIATNSGRGDTDVVVPALGLDRFTRVVVTATDVDNLKPAPDIYLLAAKRLGLPADQCIAIEDSKPGGLSAKAAGCYLIGLNDRVPNADEYITDHAAAIRRARQLLASSAE